MILERIADAAFILRTNELALAGLQSDVPPRAVAAITEACARAREDLDAALSDYFGVPAT